MAESLDIAEFLTGYAHRVETVELFGRSDLAGRIEQLQRELADCAQTVGASDDDGHIERARELAEQITQAEQALQASRVTFRFRSLPRADWSRLVIEHPATDEERQQHPGVPDVVGESFWPAAIAACAESPELTVDQAQQMGETLRTDDWDRLRMAVRRVNEEPVTVPKSGMGGAVSQLLAASSKPAKPKASRGKSGTAAKGKASPSTTTTAKGG